VQSLVFANRLLDKPPEVYPFDADKCSGCNMVFSFNAIDSMNICSICNISIPVLFQSEDTSADTLILRCIVSGTALEKSTGLVPLPVKKPTKEKNNRLPFFKKFLNQYAEVIPEDVFLYLHRCHSSNIHIPNMSSCRSTVVAIWLKESSLYSKYEKMATRITNEMCGLSSPRLSKELIEKLIVRFDQFVKASKTVLTVEQRKKNACFEFLSNRFLLLENEFKLSRTFNLPKTRTVLRECDTRFRCVAKVMGWTVSKAV